MGASLNQELLYGFDAFLAWVSTDVLGWYGIGLWLAFFLAAGLALLFWQLVRRWL